MITVLHRGDPANDYSVPWSWREYTRNLISAENSKILFMHVKLFKIIFLGGGQNVYNIVWGGRAWGWLGFKSWTPHRKRQRFLLIFIAIVVKRNCLVDLGRLATFLEFVQIEPFVEIKIVVVNFLKQKLHIPHWQYNAFVFKFKAIFDYQNRFFNFAARSNSWPQMFRYLRDLFHRAVLVCQLEFSFCDEAIPREWICSNHTVNVLHFVKWY